jgi:hypothetical protein
MLRTDDRMTVQQRAERMSWHKSYSTIPTHTEEDELKHQSVTGSGSSQVSLERKPSAVPIS